jgi:hypothetical protein
MTLFNLTYEQSSEGSLKFGEEMCPIESYIATDLTTTVVAAGLRNDIASAPPNPPPTRSSDLEPALIDAYRRKVAQSLIAFQ